MRKKKLIKSDNEMMKKNNAKLISVRLSVSRGRGK
jgi:hypothetical protein